MTARKRDLDFTPGWMRYEQAAAYLSVGVDKLRGWKEAGHINYQLFDGITFFSVEDLDKFRNSVPRRNDRRLVTDQIAS
jgi:hypothetical protein